MTSDHAMADLECRKVMNCVDVETELAAYVDGGTAVDRAAIEAHLATCDDCGGEVHAQTVARTVLRARAGQLAPIAPPGLRTRLRSVLEDERARTMPRIPAAGAAAGRWTRVSAFAAAVLVVLTLGAVLLPVTTIRSTALLAAQLALDHLKCFTIEGDADGVPMAKAEAEATLKREFDFIVTVPASLASANLELMAVRRCLYGDGRAVHLLYRLDGEPLSLFIIPGLTRPAAELSLFGHDQVVWTQGDRTYMLVARGGAREALAHVASYLRNEAK